MSNTESAKRTLSRLAKMQRDLERDAAAGHEHDQRYPEPLSQWERDPGRDDHWWLLWHIYSTA